MNYFIYYLKRTVSNMIKKEHPEHYPPMPTYTDDEGNEFDWSDRILDNSANPDTLGIMRVFNNTSQECDGCISEESIDTMQVLFDESIEESISEDEAEIRVRFIEHISKIIPCINQAKEHSGKRNAYYRAFATDFYIAASKYNLHSRYDMNENEAFHNMDLDFADWTLTAVCRSFSAFEITPCKTYEEIGVTGRNYANGEIETPFRNCVYAARFNVSDSAVSQQRKSFYMDIGILFNED